MSDWVEKPLGEIAQLDIGGTPSRDVPAYWAEDYEGGYPWLSIADLRARRIVETSERITDLGVRHSNVKRVKKGTVLMTFKLTIGEVAIAGCDLFTNEAIVAVTPKSSEISSALLFHALPKAAKAAVTDAAIKGATLNKDKLAKIVIRFPKDDEYQAAIDRSLSALNAQIEATELLIAKQARVRAGLMQDLFTRGIDGLGKLRPLRRDAPSLYHQTELGWLPNGWEAQAFVKIVDRNRPISYGILMPGQDVPDGVPVIKVRDIKGGEIIQSGLLRTSKQIDAEYARSRLREGDLLMTIRGTVGRTAIVPAELAGANITQDTARLATVGGSPDYFREYLGSPAAAMYLQRNTLGNAVQGINLRDVKSMQVPVPPPIEQAEIAARLTAHRRYSSAMLSELDALRLQKAGLMQDLLTGKVSVAPLLEVAAA